ncbi:MAG: hypothetical protein B6I24_07760 [Bacteroidetes bacterium 4572_128]|nr:MAG: hypothetical protein B6I24_07760 [Bacteroidetes bacterium 4572_128]
MKKNFKILFIDSTHKIFVEILEKNGFHCDYFPEISANEIKKIICNYQGIVIRSRIKLDKLILSKAKNLKFIARVGAGMENIDLDFAKKNNIKCFNSPEGNRDAVGEHTLGMLLSLFNNLCRADKEVKNGIWKREENRGLEIKGKTIGIIGYGNMGTAFAQRLQGFQTNIISYDKYKKDFGNSFVKEVSWNEIFEETDILSFHIPLNEETKFLFNKNLIKNFKKKIFVINTSRGKIINTNDLIDGLKNNKILGAALDVLEYEKTSFENLYKNKKNFSNFNFLKKSEKVILSPHIAGWTKESKIKLSKLLAEKICKFF